MATAVATRTLDEQAIDWLLASDEPGIRLQTRRDLLGEEAAFDPEEVLSGAKVRALLDGQQPDGGFGVDPYRKWLGAHWRLVALADLGVAGAESRARAATEPVLAWLLGRGHTSNIAVIDGRARRCASQEGNALAVCAALDMAADERVAQLAASLVLWQWPDGGWNCDREPRASHSSFHESLPPLWGLAAYARATGDRAALAAARRAAEFFLDHGTFKSHRTGDVGDQKWLELRYPHYWHYDVLYGLDRIRRAGFLPDTRAADAIGYLRSRQDDAGRWRLDGTPYWRKSGKLYRDPVAWERKGPSEMLTLNALRVLRDAATRAATA